LLFTGGTASSWEENREKERQCGGVPFGIHSPTMQIKGRQDKKGAEEKHVGASVNIA